jgi:hypothetical protein
VALKWDEFMADLVFGRISRAGARERSDTTTGGHGPRQRAGTLLS